MNRDEFYRKHILESIDKINKFIIGVNYDKFEEDDLIRSAVIRELEIIGEAAGRFSNEFKEKYKQINWSEIVGMRNKLIHDYFDVDYSIIWKTIIDDLPKLEKDLAD
jgi:uncharacterized protein with HEPN domain